MLTEQEFRKTDIFKSGKVRKPLLGLNCVGGQNALDLLRQIGHGGTMVTYGGMSREPVTVPTSALIFKVYFLRTNQRFPRIFRVFIHFLRFFMIILMHLLRTSFLGDFG